jgi:hypothetical protein
VVLNFALTALTEYNLAVSAHDAKITLRTLIHEITHLRKSVTAVGLSSRRYGFFDCGGYRLTI